ncbi:hypothetical protein GCM10027422_47340 [Hymenobacter arcticus]
MDFNRWRQKGVFFASDEEGISAFLENQYSGFDLEQILSELEAVATKWLFERGEWTRIQIGTTRAGSLHIEHYYDAGTDEEPLSLRRILKNPSPTGRRASHEEMILPPSLQRKGLSRDLIRPYYKQYKAAGVDYIDAIAGDKGGGYALARYGFDAVKKWEVFNILEQGGERGIDLRFIAILTDEAEQFYASHPDNTPFRIWEWSQTPFGEKLLVGTQWDAVLDLHDAEQVSVFEEYLYPNS